MSNPFVATAFLQPLKDHSKASHWESQARSRETMKLRGEDFLYRAMETHSVKTKSLAAGKTALAYRDQVLDRVCNTVIPTGRRK